MRPPTIVSVDPGQGPTAGGTTVVIKGEHLEGTSEVIFGETKATDIEVDSATELTVKSPAHAVGAVDVTVLTTGGASTASPADQFSFEQTYWLRSQFSTGNALASSPGGLVVNSAGDIWISQWWGNAVKEFSPGGQQIGEVSLESPCTGQLEHPWGLALDANGDLWIADSGNDRVLKLSPTGRCEQQFGSEGSGNGQFNYPTGVAIAPNGNVWVADMFNQRVQELGPNGEYVLEIGEPGVFGPALGGLMLPQGVTVDASGDVWVSEPFNGRVQEFGEKGEYLGQLSARFPEGQALATGLDGDVWLADSSGAVREFNPHLELVTSFGSLGQGEGQLEAPDGLTVDSGGDVWVSVGTPDRVEEWAPPPEEPLAATVLARARSVHDAHKDRRA